MNYIDAQFEKLSPTGVYKIKVTSLGGETHWMNITLTQVEAIRNILRKDGVIMRMQDRVSTSTPVQTGDYGTRENRDKD